MPLRKANNALTAIAKAVRRHASAVRSDCKPGSRCVLDIQGMSKNISATEAVMVAAASTGTTNDAGSGLL